MVITLVSAGAGLAEAGLLALVAYIAITMSTGSQPPSSITLGPFDLQARMSSLLITAWVLAVIRLVLQVVMARLPTQLSGHVQSALREQLINSFLAARWSEKAREREGNLQELMGAQTLQAGNAALALASGFSASLMFLALAAAAFLVSFGVAAVVMTTSLVLFSGLRPLSKRVRRYSAEAAAASAAQAQGVAESVRMAEEIEVHGVAEVERTRIMALARVLEESFVRTRSLSALVPVLYQSAVIFLIVAGLAILYVIDLGRPAALSAVVLLLIRASAYGQRFQNAYQGLGEALPYLDRVVAASRGYQAVKKVPGESSVAEIKTIQFDSVNFEYKPGLPVLRGLSFSVQQGESIGIVGPSGAGKSTLVELLLRLRKPIAGLYLVNGLPASQIRDELWHRLVAYLPQEQQLLTGTVADNIRFHRDWIDDTTVEHAARLAGIDSEIESWSGGFETIVSNRADAIAGGQRQRLCLARALAGTPELLILDEPTSALDLQSERLIQDSLGLLRGRLTIFVVAHRLSTLNQCDRVMVIRDGRIEGFSAAQQLYGSNDFYRQSVDLATSGRSVITDTTLIQRSEVGLVE